MLEVKPPNRYDDTSSDNSNSTNDELYDFNFDFVHQYDLDYKSNNLKKSTLGKDNICNVPTSVEYEKKKNDYLKYREYTMNCIDDNDNDLNYTDFNSQSDNDEEMNFNRLTSPIHNHNTVCYQKAQDYEYVFSPTTSGVRKRYNDNDIAGSETYSNTCIEVLNNMKTNNYDVDLDSRIKDEMNITFDIDGNDMNNKNNKEAIFSIYKPKNMKIPSTVRPLGASGSDLLTSIKRPLTLGPSCFLSHKKTKNVFVQTGSVEQANFKIIPEKNGLKISPLYRFGYETDNNLRLKCTARPLLFPL